MVACTLCSLPLALRSLFLVPCSLLLAPCPLLLAPCSLPLAVCPLLATRLSAPCCSDQPRLIDFPGKDHILDTPRWFEEIGRLGGVTVRESNFLKSPRVPKNVSGAVATRVDLGSKALSARQIRTALAPHAHAGVIELAFAADTFCGFDDAAEDRTFNDATMRLIEYRRSPFCYEDGVSVPPYSQCCSPRKPGDAFFPCIQGFDPPGPLPACGQLRPAPSGGGSGSWSSEV